MTPMPTKETEATRNWPQTGHGDADPALTRRGLQMLLDHFPDLRVEFVEHLGNGWTRVELRHTDRPDLVPPYGVRALTGDVHELRGHGGTYADREPFLRCEATHA